MALTKYLLIQAHLLRWDSLGFLSQWPLLNSHVIKCPFLMIPEIALGHLAIPFLTYLMSILSAAKRRSLYWCGQWLSKAHGLICSLISATFTANMECLVCKSICQQWAPSLFWHMCQLILLHNKIPLIIINNFYHQFDHNLLSFFLIFLHLSHRIFLSWIVCVLCEVCHYLVWITTKPKWCQ